MKRMLDAMCDFEWLTMAEDARFHVEALARLCHISERQLERYFLPSFGLAPKNWLSKVRLSFAPHFLLRQQPIKKIATDLGFADASHFTRVFKRGRKSTPGQFTKTALARFSECASKRISSGIAIQRSEGRLKAREISRLFCFHWQQNVKSTPDPHLERARCKGCKLHYPDLYDQCVLQKQ